MSFKPGINKIRRRLNRRLGPIVNAADLQVRPELGFENAVQTLKKDCSIRQGV